MTTRLLFAAAFVSAAFSVSAVQAQQTTTNEESIPAAQNDQAASPADSSYGGAAGQSAAGTASKWARGVKPSCSPRPFCDIYSGAQ